MVLSPLHPGYRIHSSILQANRDPLGSLPLLMSTMKAPMTGTENTPARACWPCPHHSQAEPDQKTASFQSQTPSSPTKHCPSQANCAGWNKNVPRWLIYLNAWPSVSGAVWEGFTSVALLGEMCGWQERGFETEGLALLLACSLLHAFDL